MKFTPVGVFTLYNFECGRKNQMNCNLCTYQCSAIGTGEEAKRARVRILTFSGKKNKSQNPYLRDLPQDKMIGVKKYRNSPP